MKLLLLLAFLGLLCLHAQGWTLKTDTQNEHWRELANQKNRDSQNDHRRELAKQENRELFLSALQTYLSAKGIQVNKTAPAFVLTSRDHNTVTYGRQEEQDTAMND